MFAQIRRLRQAGPKLSAAIDLHSPYFLLTNMHQHGLLELVSRFERHDRFFLMWLITIRASPPDETTQEPSISSD